MQKSKAVRITGSRPAIFLAAILLAGSAMAQSQSFLGDEEVGKLKLWEEVALQLPAVPKTDALLPFAIMPKTSQSFSIDPNALTLGTDGVVRYTLVAQSRAGASSISYEGMRCDTFEKKLYAFGRTDGSWSRARQDAWQPIFKNGANRQHVTLAQDYFCSDGHVAGDAAQIIDRIRNGRPLSISGR